MEHARQCTATNKDGNPCGAQAWKDGLCRWHHPDLETQRQASRAAGGRAKSHKAQARKYLMGSRMSPAEVEGLIARALIQVTVGEMPPGVLSALAAGARAYVVVREASEIEERLAAVETTLSDRRA